MGRSATVTMLNGILFYFILFWGDGAQVANAKIAADFLDEIKMNIPGAELGPWP